MLSFSASLIYGQLPMKLEMLTIKNGRLLLNPRFFLFAHLPLPIF
jgi:hypothetical protein